MYQQQLSKHSNTVVKHTIRLNIPLIISLGRVLGKTNTEIMEAAGIMNATWYRITRHPEQITVQQLISIANGLHIPVRRFFLYDDTDMVGSKDYYVENQYRSCYYDTKSLLHLIDKYAVSKWQDVADTLGISRSNLRNSLMLDTRLPLDRFLTACDVFGIDPFCVIIDPNPLPISQKERMDEIATKQEYATIQNEIATIHREITIFRAELFNVRQDIERLGKNIDMFIDAYYEHIKVFDEPTPIANEARKAVKEIQDRVVKQLANDKIIERSTG